jgi:hypothetical protein
MAPRIKIWLRLPGPLVCRCYPMLQPRFVSSPSQPNIERSSAFVARTGLRSLAEAIYASTFAGFFFCFAVAGLGFLTLIWLLFLSRSLGPTG